MFINLASFVLTLIYIILLTKVTVYYVIKDNISTTTEPINFSILLKLFLGIWVVLSYLIFIVFRLTPLNTELVDARSAGARRK